MPITQQGRLKRKRNGTPQPYITTAYAGEFFSNETEIPLANDKIRLRHSRDVLTCHFSGNERINRQ
jgi:hypothetical protein